MTKLLKKNINKIEKISNELGSYDFNQFMELSKFYRINKKGELFIWIYHLNTERNNFRRFNRWYNNKQ